MQLEQRNIGDIAIVKVTGDITLNKGGDILLKDKINSLLQQGQKKVLLYLCAVTYVDSAGLGQLVHAHTTTPHHGGKRQLVNLDKRHDELLVMTELAKLF